MSEILKKIKLRIRRCEVQELKTTAIFISDLKEIVSELEELQDAIVEFNLHILLEDFDQDLDFVKTLNNAIQASNRRKNNEQLWYRTMQERWWIGYT